MNDRRALEEVLDRSTDIGELLELLGPDDRDRPELDEPVTASSPAAATLRSWARSPMRA